MKKIILILIIYIFNLSVFSTETKKAYFAGGCFWCMEESYDQVNGVLSSVSGYSGGHLKNPKYEDIIYKDTGHVEVIEVTYDPLIVSYKDLLEVYWKNIDPFDAEGQFCDKGKSYRSVIFFENNIQKGEFTIIIGGKEKNLEEENNLKSIKDDLLNLIELGLNHSAAAIFLSKKYKKPKNQVYKLLFDDNLK